MSVVATPPSPMSRQTGLHTGRRKVGGDSPGTHVHALCPLGSGRGSSQRLTTHRVPSRKEPPQLACTRPSHFRARAWAPQVAELLLAVRSALHAPRQLAIVPQAMATPSLGDGAGDCSDFSGPFTDRSRASRLGKGSTRAACSTCSRAPPAHGALKLTIQATTIDQSVRVRRM